MFSTLLSFNCWSQADTWLKINHPDSSIKASLKDQGIHYDNFIFIKKSDVENTLVATELNSLQSQEIIRPFHFRIDDFYVDLSTDTLSTSPWLTAPENSGIGFHLVQFNGPIKPEWLNELEQQQVQLVSPMAPFSWIVWADAEQIASIEQNVAVRVSEYFYQAFRVSETNRNLPSHPTPSMALVLSQQLNHSIEQLISLGAQNVLPVRINDRLSALNFTLPGTQYLAAAQIPAMLTVQKIQQDAGPRGEMSQQSIVGNIDGSGVVQTGYQTWLDDTGLDGNGVTVAVVDGGIFQNHPDLGNVVACTGVGASCIDGNGSHGSHVAGAVAGTGVNGSLNAAGFNRGMGVAPATEIVEQLYPPLLGGGPGGMVAGGMLSIYKDSATSGATLSNNSWGPTGTPQGYDIPTMEVDMISRDANPDVAGDQPVLAVWSIMNGNGDSNSACSPSSLGSPDEAKNLFAVGSTALQNTNATQVSDVLDVSSNSAHGPACDGRLVPHIVAPGCRTESTGTSTGYSMDCGTSMASPVISGSIALFIEQYRNEYGAEPSPALIKAVFTVVTDDLVGQDDADGNVMSRAPNRQQGWGRVDLDRVINPEAGFWLYDQVTIFTTSGENWQQNLIPIDPTEPMRLMLVWTDAPGAGLGGSNAAWVNDLDLSVTADQLYLGNQFGTDAYSVAGGSADVINNMEAVFLRVDQHNGQSISVEVLASNIMADALNPHVPDMPQQDFAFACYNCEPAVMVNNDLIFSDGFDVFIDLIFADGFE